MKIGVRERCGVGWQRLLDIKIYVYSGKKWRIVFEWGSFVLISLRKRVLYLPSDNNGELINAV